MNLEPICDIIRRGDLQGLDRLNAAGMLEGATAEEKRFLTRVAARGGKSAVLRHMFEAVHLYSVEPDKQGRTVAHDAAMSGDAETLRFTTEVLGFDPLAGDADGWTAMDYAARAERPDASRWLTGCLGFGPEDIYRNPVLRGFHPDPSIVRVGEDYYLVNSSFVFFPGLPVSHSRDLIHWRVIGHAAEDLAASGLEGLPGGFGYWAPDISYFKGRFWVVATLRRDTPPYRLQMITSAADPAGPWDQPRFLPLDGIDPSLFADDDGRRYILLNPGAILAEISDEGELISAPQMISFGSARIKPEGPHLLKKDGWYYLFLAEGGTGFDHMETVLRSRSLRGPYESCPFNPILSRKNPLSPIQRSGHGKPFMLPDGRWMMVYLCGRPVEGRTPMGRETALDPLDWTADGWPMVNQLKGPSCLQKKPLPDQGGGEDRNREWVSPRGDSREFAVLEGDCISLRCGTDPARRDPCSLLLRRQTERSFSHSAHADLSEAEENSFAGLTGYYDERSFFLFGIRGGKDGYTLELTEQIGEDRRVQTLGNLPGPSAELAIRGDGFRRTLLCGGREVLTFRADYLCDEGVGGGKRFTGALTGLFALGKGTARFTAYQDEMRLPVPEDEGASATLPEES